jgi:membrane protease YdiL (CAAX protease family)
MNETRPDRLAEELRGFGPAGVTSMLVILLGNLLFLPLSAILALAWARRTATPWSELGLKPPRRWLPTIAGGIVIGVALKLFSKAVLLPLLHADPINHAFHHLVGNHAAIPFMLYQLVIGAGFGEEVLYRGYLFERLGSLLGRGTRARLLTLLFTSLLFAAAHLPEQGVPGAEQALLTGLTFGGLYLATGSLALPMITHASFDLLSYAIIFFDLEARVAHLVFH